MARRPSPLRILAAGAAWRMFGTRGSAETLMQAVAGDDESNRMLAGMALVKAGRRSFDLIEALIDNGEAPTGVVRLLPDIDGTRARPVMARIIENGPAGLVDTAKQCVELLDRIETSESGDE